MLLTRFIQETEAQAQLNKLAVAATYECQHMCLDVVKSTLLEQSQVADATRLSYSHE